MSDSDDEITLVKMAEEESAPAEAADLKLDDMPPLVYDKDQPGLQKSDPGFGVSPLKHLTAKQVASLQEEEEKEMVLMQIECVKQALILKVSVVAVILTYIAIGVVVFYFLEGWTLVDTVYFVIVTVTTVGFGDISPETFLGRWFCTGYCFLAIGLLGIAVGIHECRLVEKVDAEEVQEIDVQEDFVDLLADAQSMRCTARVAIKMASALVPIALFYLAGALFFTYTDLQLDFTDSVYMAGISLTTVGFGDFYPTTTSGKVFVIFWIPSGVVVISHGISKIGKLYVARHVKISQMRRLGKGVTVGEILRHGANDGKLSMNEFSILKLLSQGKITPVDLQQTKKYFRKMDTDGSGFIEVQELLGYQEAQKNHSS